jgi:two-component system, OmpR family, sensor histidine kinase MtrB
MTRLWRWLRARWRRSLQLRVVAATLALGLVVVVVIGQLLLQRIADDLVESARVADQADAAKQVGDTVTAFRGQKWQNYQDFRDWAQDRVSELRGPEDAPLHYLALLKSLGSPAGPILDQGLGIDRNSIPGELRTRVVQGGDKLQTQQITVPLRDGSSLASRPQPVMLVGTLLDFGSLSAGNNASLTGGESTGRYELYFAYKLDHEVAILDNVRRSVTWGSLALLSLVVMLAWLVTRTVVAPVRQAAGIAEQLASGHLDRRMRVRGDDDLARLARGFNEMAVSLERQILQLEDLSRVQQRFVSDVSHELRTPLTTIRMAAELLHDRRSDFDPAVARSAELLHDQLDRFEELLADLLEVSRFDAGAARLEPEPTEVGALVTRVVEGLRPLAERKGCELVVESDRPALAEVETRRVERIVRNLVANAVEHGEGRPVSVRVSSDETAVAVGVRDLGVGLRPHEVRMVFNRFWRADPARARQTGGTGLGLAISLEDAHLHGGWLQAWGTPGGGAHFRLTLPRQAGTALMGSPLALVPPDAHATLRGRPRTPIPGEAAQPDGDLSDVES